MATLQKPSSIRRPVVLHYEIFKFLSNGGDAEKSVFGLFLFYLGLGRCRRAFYRESSTSKWDFSNKRPF